MDKEIPKIDLPENCIIGQLSREDTGLLSLYANFPCRLKAGIFVLCMDGVIEASINLARFRVKPHSFITILPGTIFQIHQIEGDVKINFMGFSSAFIQQANVHKSFDAVYSIKENPVIELDQTAAELLKDYMNVLARTYLLYNKQLSPEILKHLFSGIMMGASAMYKNQIYSENGLSKAEQISKSFEQLVMQNYTKERSVNWYARKMNITPAHLSTMVRQSTGKTCIDIITAMVIIDAKAQLKSTHLSIHDIAYSLNFTNMSFFGKYFKRHVGVGPLEYRNS